MLNRWVGALVGLAMVGLAGSASATALTITTYSDLTTWEAAAGSTALFDFNSTSTVSNFGSQDFGDFTVSESSADLQLSIVSGAGGGNIDGSNYLEFLEQRSGSPLVTVSFDFAIAAFSFDFVNTDTTGDFSQMIVDGQVFDVGSALSSGFFGFTISDGTVTSFNLRDDPSGGGALVFANYDNFRYDVPEPSTLALFGIGLAGLGFIGWRRRRKAAA